MNAYCLQCKTGAERQIMQWINKSFNLDELGAIAPVKSMQEKRNHVWVDVQKPLLTGYVFVYCQYEDHTFVVEPDLQIHRNVYKWIEYGEGEHQLKGRDAEYAEWIYRNHGIIGSSDILVVGNIFQVASGPIQGCAGKIIRIDRHKRKATIEIDFDGTKRWMTLSVNLLDPIYD